MKKNVYAAHFDILGMGAKIKMNDGEAWYNILSLSEALDKDELPISDAERRRLSERYFFDTVLITSEDESELSLQTILIRSLELFRCALRKGIPLRGGVAHGSWFEKKQGRKDLFTGTALTSAYNLGETQQLLCISVCSAIYSRFYADKPLFNLTSRERVIDCTALPALNYSRSAKEKRVILERSIPVKEEVEKRYILNWPAICDLELRGISLDDAESFRRRFWTVNQNTDLKDYALAKYKNTLELINDIYCMEG